MRRPLPPSPSAASAAPSPQASPSPTYRGVRRRSWGKWVAEIRQPRTRSRLWLGSYLSPEAAARAFDAASFLLRRHSARLNLPQLLPPYLAHLPSLSPKSIQKMAIATGSMADTLISSPPVGFSDQSSSISTTDGKSNSVAPKHLSPNRAASTEQSSSSLSNSVAEDRRSSPPEASDSSYSINHPDDAIGKPNWPPNDYAITFGNDSVARMQEMDEGIGGLPAFVSAKTDKNTERSINGLMYEVKANVNGSQHKPTEAEAVLIRSTIATGRRPSEECVPERTNRGCHEKDALDSHSKVDVQMEWRRRDNVCPPVLVPATLVSAAGIGTMEEGESIPMPKSSPKDEERIRGSRDRKQNLKMSTNLEIHREFGKNGDDGEVYGEGWKGRTEILMGELREESPKPTMEQIVRAMLLESVPLPGREQDEEQQGMPMMIMKDVDDQDVGTEEEENHYHHQDSVSLWHYNH